jgi:hypothetical protein
MSRAEPADTEPVDTEDVRLQVYRSFADRGVAPTIDELASTLGGSQVEMRRALHRLAADRHLVLAADDSILMAHPFASIPLGFSVMGRQTLWWGGCAWDSFAMPHLLTGEDELLVATRCPGCGAAHAWSVGSTEPPAGDQVAHFLVPAAHIWDDVVHTCSHQRIFCSRGCVERWLTRTSQEEGYVMDLATLWRFASRWYEGRLERGYQRRDPTTAADYMRASGLSGSFWGL